MAHHLVVRDSVVKAPQELVSHVRGSLNNGCTEEEIQEVVLHRAMYADVPASAEAFRAAQQVYDLQESGPTVPTVFKHVQ
nr:carboxymuconolactone decarboxylase family protein [Pseudomonas putida]HDS0977629.1 carboxymuconolactone decarboxylase family protein [Pseudomonas putida]